MKKNRIIYYENELEDEFSEAQLDTVHIGADYEYCREGAWRRFTHFFWYRVVATPLAFLYSRVVLGQRIVGAQVMRPYLDGGFFMFGNHTQPVGDALMPHMIWTRKEKYTVVHPSNLKAHAVGPVTPSLGALPLPSTREAQRNFYSAIERRIGEGAAVIIYPEAHIWPWCSFIRDFRDDSFYYPVKMNVPSFSFTNVYMKRRHSEKPRIVTYVDGPFLPDESLPYRERRRDLAERVKKKMRERAALSDCEYIKYLKKDDVK